MSVTRLRATPGWAAFAVPLDAAPPAAGTEGQMFAARACAYLRETRAMELEVFLLGRRMYLDGGTNILNRNTVSWRPKVGIGLWPTRPAPRRRTPEDAMDEAADMLMAREPEKTVDLMLRLAGDIPARESAIQQMLGRGVVTLIFSRMPYGEWEQRLRARYLPTIDDSSYHYERFYLPQFDRNNLETASDEQLTDWTCGASVYIRESPNDKALLVLCEPELATALTAEMVVTASAAHSV